MTTKRLLFNARVHTQAGGLIVDSLVLNKNRVVAVGNNLQHDSDFSSYPKIDMSGLTITPGFVDAHTHLYYMALSYGRVWLQGLTSVDACLEKIREHSTNLGKNEWVVGEGFELNLFKKRVELTRQMLDNVTGGRPAMILSKDQHTAWVNSRALKLAGITSRTKQPTGGRIGIGSDGNPNGLLYEGPAAWQVYALIGSPTRPQIDRYYRRALETAYRAGVTGVHSFDGPDGFAYFAELAEKNRLGLRINYYPPAQMLAQLRRTGMRYGVGDEFLRVAGVKLFADGSLGSQTALCFNKYPSSDNYGIEVTSPDKLKKLVNSAARLGLPSAIHAIGDLAVSNVLDAFESAPKLKPTARHRVEHLQLLRRKDIARLKSLGVVASMQPSHCPADIDLVAKYWPTRGRNAYIFKTLTERGIPLAFGSDAPIEALNPLAGIAAAVQRSRPGKRQVFYPEERISAQMALHNFTAGPAFAVGQEQSRGYLLPGYPADLVVLSDDITRVAASKIAETEILATFLDGRLKYYRDELKF